MKTALVKACIEPVRDLKRICVELRAKDRMVHGVVNEDVIKIFLDHLMASDVTMRERFLLFESRPSFEFKKRLGLWCGSRQVKSARYRTDDYTDRERFHAPLNCHATLLGPPVQRGRYFNTPSASSRVGVCE
jgi:hypothetical protein